MVNGSCSSDSGSGRRERLRGERFGAHSAHQYFTLPCGHGRHSAQNRSSFPCVQPTQATQLSRRLPWGHGLHVAQLSFRFPCGHRFITSRSPLYHRRPRARGRVWRTREASSLPCRQTKIDSSARPRPSYVSDRSRKLPSLSATVLWGFKIRVIDWSTVRVERKPFRGVFSERGRRDATSATRGGTRRVRDRKSLVSARHTRGSVTHRRERPSSGARRSSENRSAPKSGRRCTQAYRPARAGVRITTTAMTSHDKVREGELRGCAEAAFRAMRGSSERAMRDCSLIVRYPHGAETVRSYALRRRPAVRRATRQDVRHAVVSRVPRVQSADALESTSSPARSGGFVRDAERVQTFPTRRATPHRGLPTRRDRRVD